jgi:serine-type D-Ala-D-Ala carboxypeptidase (penicillin-binding protein 5/6)
MHSRRTRCAALAFVVALLPLGIASAGPPSADTADRLEVPAADAASIGAREGLSLLLIEGLSGQVLLAQDARQVRPVASIIKLVTALAVVDALPPRSLIDVGDEVLDVDGARFGLRPGEQWSVEDLLAALLLRSGNEVAVALAVAVAGSESAFVDRMADVLVQLGIDGVRPASASGLALGDALSAEQLGTVSRAALAEPRIATIVGLRATTAAGREADLTNRNLLIGRYDGANGIKTGFTEAAGYSLAASARRDGRELIAIVLGAASEQERLVLAERLLDHGFLRTELRTVGGELELRTGAGRVLLATPRANVTTPIGHDVTLAWPTLLRGADQSGQVAVMLDRRSIGALPVVRVDAQDRRTGDASLGQGLADGVYTSLRAASLAGLLG